MKPEQTSIEAQLPVAKANQVAASALEQLDVLAGLAKVLLRGSALSKLRTAAALEALSAELKGIADVERRTKVSKATV